jgi:hypothetical protein
LLLQLATQLQLLPALLVLEINRRNMARKKKQEAHGSAVSVKGFFRINIVEDQDGETKVVGDSGWNENLITNFGFQNGLCACLGGVSGSSQLAAVALGTGTAPGATDTTLNGEITDVAGARMTGTNISISTIASRTLQVAATLNSGVYTAAKTIQNVGLFFGTATTSSTLFAGNTYATSQLATNQSVNLSYQIRLSTA